MSHLLHCSCTMVYRGLPWYTMVCIPWYTMVYHGGRTNHGMVYHGITLRYSWGVNSAKIHNYPFFSMQLEYWILTCKVFRPIPAISAYSAIFPPSSAAIWRSIANHLRLCMHRCADACFIWTCVFTATTTTIAMSSDQMPSVRVEYQEFEYIYIT